jgi:hypothetical protein
VEEEQDEMFPDAKKYLGEKRLVELGLQLEERKQNLRAEMGLEVEKARRPSRHRKYQGYEIQITQLVKI